MRWVFCRRCETRHDPREPVTTCDQTIAYRKLAAHPPAQLDCQHGVPLGAIRRPWCHTPACAQCRYGPRLAWRFLDQVMELK